MGFLTEIVGRVRHGLVEAPLDARRLAEEAAAAEPRDFTAALASRSPALIAEVKRASPSAGSISPAADPVAQATAYARGGAAAISVLTEPAHFGGSLIDLRTVADVVVVPVLRKDFLVDPIQVLESRAAGADAVLVIAAALDDVELADLLAAAAEHGLGALVEAHGDDDLERALASGARVVGVNARDLETLEVDLEAALARLERVPPDRVAVLESGIATRADVQAAVSAGASAILVGEALMRAPDPASAVRRLLGSEEET